jgi:hypothetical protein
MRNEWRNVLAILTLFLMGTGSAHAQLEASKEAVNAGTETVHMTIEVNWEAQHNEHKSLEGAIKGGNSESPPALTLEIASGRVVDAVRCSTEFPNESASLARASSAFGPGDRGSWCLGREREGRVRAQIEAPLDATIAVRRADQVVSMPLVAILEKAQHTPPQSELSVNVERVAWDALRVDFGEPAADGIAAPGSMVPVSIGFNILAPEAATVAVRTTAVLRSLRGGEVVWRSEAREREAVLTGGREPATRTLNMVAPRTEGAYVLEISASWEPTGGREGSRIGRLIRRRKPTAVVNTATRRVSLTVLEQTAIPTGARGREAEADSLDLTRSRSLRPLATGRSPVAGPGPFAWAVPSQALIEPSRRDRLLGWILRTNAEASKLDRADAAGLAWSAVGLRVSHPDHPHRLTLKVKGGEPSALGVALVEPKSASSTSSPRLLLDACAAGPLILPEGPPTVFNWLVWPTTTEMVLVLVNRSFDAEVTLGTVTLTELDDTALVSSNTEPRSLPGGSRTLGLYLNGPRALEPFGGVQGAGDALQCAAKLAKHVRSCGATSVVVPASLADRAARRELALQADEDSTGPDRLETIRRVLARQGCSLWLELAFDGPGSLPGLPPADSAEAQSRGLVRVDRQGRVDSAVYHALHPEVREAMKRRVLAALAPAKAAVGPGEMSNIGLMIRLGPGPTLLGTPEMGLDDLTYDRFVRETFSSETARNVPGLGTSDPERFAVRTRYVAGVGRMPWLTWRARAVAALYGELAEATRATVPGAVLAVITPSMESGPAGAEARRVDRAGLAPSQAWRSVGLDLQVWPNGPLAPVVLRGVALSTDALAHDLATSPDLDALVALRSHRGLLLSIEGNGATAGSAAAPEMDPQPLDGLELTAPGLLPSAVGDSGETGGTRADSPDSKAVLKKPGQSVLLTAMPLGDGPNADEPLGHALAALDAHYVFLSAKAAAGHESRLRTFATVLKSLPDWPPLPLSPATTADSKPFGITLRQMSDATQTYFELANDSPYPIRLAGLLTAPESARVEDLGRGVRLSPVPEGTGRKLVLDLLPFGVAAIRVGAPRTSISAVTPYPSDAVLADMQARFNELSGQLARLNRGLAIAPAEPSNPGFEPEGSLDAAKPNGPNVVPTGAEAPAGPAPVAARPRGWTVEGNPANANILVIDRTNPHSGQGSLRITSTRGAISAMSDSFTPGVQSSLVIQAFVRASAPNSKVRVWIEGQASGKPYVRHSDLNVGVEWEAQAVRASDLPVGGLDSTRLRFEVLEPGSVWIDDLHVTGESNPKYARLNAQRTLLSALQAYREQRYADFARLAGSHWVRESSQAVGRLAGLPRPAPKPGAGSGGAADATPSALPPDRKLR